MLGFVLGRGRDERGGKSERIIWSSCVEEDEVRRSERTMMALERKRSMGYGCGISSFCSSLLDLSLPLAGVGTIAATPTASARDDKASFPPRRACCGNERWMAVAGLAFTAESSWLRRATK